MCTTCPEEVEVPSVDNTGSKCDKCGYYSTDCIINEEALLFLDLPEDSSLTDVILKIQTMLEDIKTLTDDFESRIAALEA